jgi:hypothetical protein
VHPHFDQLAEQHAQAAAGEKDREVGIPTKIRVMVCSHLLSQDSRPENWNWSVLALEKATE